MHMAHLYQAIRLVNRGIDDAVRGLERLKHATDSGLNPGYFDEKLPLFEVHRALLNGCFCNNVEGCERRDEARYARDTASTKGACWTKCRSIKTCKRLRKTGAWRGKATRLRFLSSEVEQAWEQQYPKPPTGTADRVQAGSEASDHG